MFSLWVILLGIALVLHSSSPIVPVVEAKQPSTSGNATTLIAFRKGSGWGPTTLPQSFFSASIWAGFVAQLIPDNGLADLITGRFRHPSRKYLMIPGGVVTSSFAARVDLTMKIVLLRLAGQTEINNEDAGGAQQNADDPDDGNKMYVTANYLFFITQAPIVFFLLQAGGALVLSNVHTGVVISATAIYSNVGALLILALGQLIIKLLIAALTGKRAVSNNLTSPFLHAVSFLIIPTAMHGAFYFTQEDLMIQKPTMHNVVVGIVIAVFIAMFLGSLLSNCFPAPGDSWRQFMSWWYAPMCPTPPERGHCCWIVISFLFSALLGMAGGNWIGEIFDGRTEHEQLLFSYGLFALNLLSSVSNAVAAALLPDSRKLAIPAFFSDLLIAICCLPQIDGNVSGCLLALALWGWCIRAVIIHIIFPLVDSRTSVPPPRLFQQALQEHPDLLMVEVDPQSDNSDDGENDEDEMNSRSSVQAQRHSPVQQQEVAISPRPDGSTAGTASVEPPTAPSFAEAPTDYVPPKLPSLSKLQNLPPPTTSATSLRLPAAVVEVKSSASGKAPYKELPPPWIRHLPNPSIAAEAQRRRSSILKVDGDQQSLKSPLQTPRSGGSSSGEAPTNSSIAGVSPIVSPRILTPRSGSSTVPNDSFASSENASPRRCVSFCDADVADPSKYRKRSTTKPPSRPVIPVVVPSSTAPTGTRLSAVLASPTVPPTASAIATAALRSPALTSPTRAPPLSARSSTSAFSAATQDDIL